ncbi:hypothetical protein BV25DRAFT_1818467 [Artomyces pyxidatus]|uniref:Uncharacterized protein n=1 Tax=Artomyces pyxidatus TaxID=48021 RepID=A0ACB8TI54_9AGAM|nr:hypothetical protein BV25DRAFT_1818467 [Artomyces pyxidatus]
MATTARQLYLDDWKSKGLDIRQICAGCFRHLRVAFHVHVGGPQCIKCLPATMTTLRRCTACKVSFYCSRECQKKDWAKHRVNCINMVSTAPRIDMELKRADAFGEGWCDRPEIEVAAKSAMHFTPRTVRGSYIFLVYVDATVTYDPPSAPSIAEHAKFAFHVVDARWAPRSDIRDVLVNMLLEPDADEPEGGSDVQLRKMEKYLLRPKKDMTDGVPVLVIDKGARYPHKFFADVHEDWLERFKRDASD